MSLDITPSTPVGRQLLQSYGDNRFRISDEVYETPILVFPDQTLVWPISSIEQLDLESLSAVINSELSIELLLIGCGKSIAVIPPSLREELKQSGIVVEPMDTGAACRTFNVLAAEDRRVAAALIPVV